MSIADKITTLSDELNQLEAVKGKKVNKKVREQKEAEIMHEKGD